MADAALERIQALEAKQAAQPEGVKAITSDGHSLTLDTEAAEAKLARLRRAVAIRSGRRKRCSSIDLSRVGL